MNLEIRKSLNCLLWNGTFNAAADTISSGALLIAYATLLGASTTYIGIIVSLPFFANLMNFFVSFLLEKGVSCKKIAVVSSLLSKPMYFIIAILPLLFDKHHILIYMFLCIFMLYFSGNITSGAFFVWVKRIIPEKILGVFFSKRYSFMMIARIICYTSLYVLLKTIKQSNETSQIHAYSVMFFGAFLLGIITTILLFMVKSPVVKYEYPGFWGNLRIGFKSKHFQKIVLFMSSLNFLTNFFFPFVTVFMLKSLNYSMDTVIIITILFQLAYIFSARIWGVLSDSTNIKTPLLYAFSILIACITGFLVISWHHPQNTTMLLIIIAVLHIFLGAVNSAFQLGSNNIPLIYIPEINANTLIPVMNAIKSFFAGLGSSFAGMYIAYCSKREILWNIGNKDGWFLFFASSIIACVYLIYISRYLKKGEIVDK